MSTRDKEGQNIMIKGPIHQEDTIVVRDFNTHVIPDRKINKETLDLNHTLGKTDLADMYRHISSNRSRIHTLLKCMGTFSRIDHIIGHKTSLSKFKKTEIIPSIFSDYNDTKVKINKRRTEKNLQICGK